MLNTEQFRTPKGAPLPDVVRTHASLRPDIGRWRLFDLLEECAEAYDLNDTDLRVLRHWFRRCPDRDFSDAKASPVCFERQSCVAAKIGKSIRTIHRVEAKLERMGFIRRDTASNGFRGRVSGSKGLATCAGISLEPLIERFDELEGKANEIRERNERFDRYRIEVKMLRRHLGYLASMNETLQKRFEDQRTDWVSPSKITGQTLVDHFFELESLVDEYKEYLDSMTNMTSTDAKNGRCHIQTTIQNKNVSCSGASTQRADCKQSDTIKYASANASADCLENKDEPGTSEGKDTFAKSLALQQMIDLASEDMRLYIDNLRDAGTPRMPIDVDVAAERYSADMGVSRRLWRECLETMGFETAALCLIVLDRNRFHPTHPVGSLPGALTALLRRYKAGNLDLQKSVYGIWRRGDGETKPH